MFRKIIDYCTKNGFLRVIEYPSMDSFQLKLGPTGVLLQENLNREWLDNFIHSKEISVFYSKEDFKDTYNYGRNILFQTVPLGIVEKLPVKKNSFVNVEDFTNSKENNYMQKKFSDFFMNDFRLVYTIFVAPSLKNQFFHQIQRQRKIWWRKISASPGRYSLGDIQNEIGSENSCSSVSIEAQYPWGNQLLESIKLQSLNYPGLTNSDLMIKDGKKQVPSVFIQCETKLSSLLLNSLCDSFEEAVLQEEQRPLLRFHRKVAPYKIAFAITSPKNAEVFNELQDLALYLTKLFRNNYITTLLLPTNVRKTLEAQFRQYDNLGIPYSVFLNEGTLKDGIAWLRSRDTTLKEQVHVADVVSYVEKIFKNF